MAIREELLELLRRDPAFRDEVRRQLLTDEVLGLPAAIRELVEAQRRVTEQIARIDQQIERQGQQIERQGQQIERQGQQIERIAQQIEQHSQQLARQSDDVAALVGWQRGEAGRRDGERYERDTVRRAAGLFAGGVGGSPDDASVRQRLGDQLGTRLHEAIVSAEDDPFLADLIWWKASRVAVVEVSLRVDASAVTRASARATTLVRAGAGVVAIVIGDEWAGPQVASQAEALGVEWKVGSSLSPGFVAFRRQADASRG